MPYIVIENATQKIMRTSSQTYYKERGRVMNVRKFRNFAQITGEHAVRLCDLNDSVKQERTRNQWGNWVDIHELIKEWANMIAPKDDTFAKTTDGLLRAYTECLADYILDKRGTPEWERKLQDLVKKETLFFNALGGEGKDTKKYWIAYTGAVVHMVDIMERYGHNSEPYYDAAANTISTGTLLGQQLDYLFI